MRGLSDNGMTGTEEVLRHMCPRCSCLQEHPQRESTLDTMRCGRCGEWTADFMWKMKGVVEGSATLCDEESADEEKDKWQGACKAQGAELAL